jgi:hypothetical protein
MNRSALWNLQRSKVPSNRAPRHCGVRLAGACKEEWRKAFADAHPAGVWDARCSAFGAVGKPFALPARSRQASTYNPWALWTAGGAMVPREVDPLFKVGSLLLCLGKIAVEALL